jgi:uncharacterized protein
MPLTFNLRHLEEKELHLQGELPAEELDLAGIDELIELSEPVRYNLTVERLGHNVLVQGKLRCNLRCQCVRCLKELVHPLDIPHWACDLPLTGEDKVAVNNDFVDLTPYLREDILLAFPQHPLCEPDCPGLPETGRNLRRESGVEEQINGASAAWSELNKLKF